jgi:TAG lipase/steryl ester hydrolase/phospholipase A2/LPA acyltransferase
MNARAWLGPSTTRARSYEEWKQAAIARDEEMGRSGWKEVDRTRLYDHVTVRSRLELLRSLRAARDDVGLIGMLDEGLHGNFAGMGRAELYARAEFGTKVLIGEYIEAVCEALRHLAKTADSSLGKRQKREFFERARVCFGQSALLLSGGGIYGNFHAGVVKVLVEQDLLPTVISGSSAGALIAAIVGTTSREELVHLLDEKQLLVETRREASLLRHGFKGLLPQFDLHAVIRHVERLVPDMTFAEAHGRSGIRLNISVSPAQLHQMPRLLNAATTPHVLVRSAVLASCAVPGVFPPAMLVAKSRGGEAQAYMPHLRWYDGSMHEDVPGQRLSRLYGVNHCIVSQVNPFALALSRHQGRHLGPLTPVLQFWHQCGLGIAHAWQDLAGRHGRRWPRLNFAINGLVSVLAQNYRGDINILPQFGMVKAWRGMKNPTEAELRELIRAGERATWPEVEMIRNCTRIGRTLDEILSGLEGPDRSAR